MYQCLSFCHVSSQVRQVGGRPDIAFIEYDTEGHAAEAKDTLHGFKLTPSNAMTIAYAKK